MPPAPNHAVCACAFTMCMYTYTYIYIYMRIHLHMYLYIHNMDVNKYTYVYEQEIPKSSDTTRVQFRKPPFRGTLFDAAGCGREGGRETASKRTCSPLHTSEEKLEPRPKLGLWDNVDGIEWHQESREAASLQKTWKASSLRFGATLSQVWATLGYSGLSR